MGILSPDLQEFMQSIAPGQAGAAGSNLLDRILAERQRQGQFQTSPFNPYGTPTDVLNQGFGTPPFNPNTPAPPSPPSAPPSAAPEKRTGLGNILIDRLANPLLNKLGKPGQAVAGGLNKFADFAGDVSGSLRQTAERGGLGALAPKFSAGVQAAAQREVDTAYKQALTELAKVQASGAAGGGASTPLTEMAKLQRDYEAGLIDEKVYNAKLQELFAKETSRQFEQTGTLRNEFYDRVEPITKSKQSLAQAASLLATTDNPLADLAALISTIRSIDESVVRGEELAAYKSMLGIVADLENAVSQAKGKGFSPETRRHIAGMMQALKVPLDEIEAGWRTFYRGEASKSNLDPDSIVGGPSQDINVPVIETNAGPNDPPPPPVDENARPSRGI